jgi:hypothetical protein
MESKGRKYRVLLTLDDWENSDAKLRQGIVKALKTMLNVPAVIIDCDEITPKEIEERRRRAEIAAQQGR